MRKGKPTQEKRREKEKRREDQPKTSDLDPLIEEGETNTREEKRRLTLNLRFRSVN